MRTTRHSKSVGARQSAALFLVALCGFLEATPHALAQNTSVLGRPGPGPVKRPTPPDLRVGQAPAATPYVLIAANCGTSSPVLTFSVVVTNVGGSASPAQPVPLLYAVDSSLNPEWMGEAPLPPLNPGQSVAVKIPVMTYAPALAMGGNAGVTHNFRFLIKGAPSNQGVNQHGSVPLKIAVAVPAAFCMQRPPQPGQQDPKLDKEISSGSPQSRIGATTSSAALSANTLGDMASPKSASTPSLAQLKARLKANPAMRKAGAIQVILDAPAKLNHVAMMSALQKQSASTNQERATSVASAVPAGLTVQPSAGGQPQNSSACPSPSILTMNGLPIPTPSTGNPAPPKGRGIRLPGQSGGAIKANGPQPAQFTSVPEYNLYTIRGCGFGQAQGGLMITGPFPSTIPALTISSWSDTQIVASLSPFITGVPDIWGGVTLELYLQGTVTPSLQIPGFSFYAAREEQEMGTFRGSQATAQPVKDVAGNPIFAAVWPQGGGDYFGGYWPVPAVEVDRVGTLPFSVAGDSFDFSKMLPGFYVDRYQLYYLDATTDIRSFCAPAGPTVQISTDTAGSWATSWDQQYRILHVSTEEQHCHITNTSINSSTDWSVSVYAIRAWVVGPKGVGPWPSNLQ